MSKVDADLGNLLAKALPAEVKLTVRHVSSAPTPCAALFAAPPGQEPESTFCENHFLSVSVHPEREKNESNKNNDEQQQSPPAAASEPQPQPPPQDEELLVFGIEVLVYSTAHLTTIFVSKADSTGYLHLLKPAPPPRTSLLRRISHTFLAYLVQTRQRPGVRLLVSLFARAQNQYLFPGSIENEGKHVLDDRGLVKWWCRVVDPILREYESESASQGKGTHDRAAESAKSSATAFLIVPGCDRLETRGFFPPSAKTDDGERPRWLNSYPLRQLVDDPDAPPRCLIPRFPDDPKTRFLVDLDDELPEEKNKEEGEGGREITSTGHWRSVRSLEQFWEMMSFRQECSAGRLVGFLWLVINPPGLVNSIQMTSSRPVVPTATSQEESSQAVSEPPSSSAPAEVSPHVQPKTAPTTEPNGFYWPSAGRGHAVLNEQDYKAAIDALFELDFSTRDVSVSSTKTWSDKVASLADELWVGQQVVGNNTSISPSTPEVAEANPLMVRKRKKPDDSTQTGEGDKEPSGGETASGVNMLQGNLIRKKKKA